MKKKYIFGFIVLVILLLVTLSKCHKGQDKGKDTKDLIQLNKADVVKAEVGDFEEFISITGDLTPRNQTIISSEVTAKVQQLIVNEGQMVKKGQVLAKLEQDTIQQSVLAQRATTKQSQDTLALQEKIMRQQKELYKENFISELAYAQYENNYNNAKQNYYAQQALLNQAEQNLSRTTILAPFDGVVVKSNSEIGQLAMPNTSLFVLADLRSIVIQAPVVSDNIAKVEIGQKVIFTIENDTKQYLGQIERIGQSAQDGTRDFPVYINFDNTKYKLKGGQFIHGAIIVRTLKKSTIVPCTAIKNQSEVLSIADGKVLNIPIQIIGQDDINNRCAIKGAVANGTLLINGNLTGIKPNTKAQLV